MKGEVMGCGILRRQARPYSSVDEGCNQGRNGWVAQWNKPLEHWNIGTLEGDFIGGSAEGVGAGPLLPVAGANHATRQWWRMLRELEKVQSGKGRGEPSVVHGRHPWPSGRLLENPSNTLVTANQIRLACARHAREGTLQIDLQESS